MNAGDWISLLTCAGALGGLALVVRAALGSGQDEWPVRPVWLVLLEGGTEGRDCPDDSDGGDGDDRPPLVPPYGGASGRPGCERRRRSARRPSRRLRVARDET